MKESKLTKWTLILCALLLTAYFSVDARADEEVDVSMISSMCAALYTVHGDQDNTVWWIDFSYVWHNDDALAAHANQSARDSIDDSMRGTPAWNDALVACADMRTEIEAMQEGES